MQFRFYFFLLGKICHVTDSVLSLEVLVASDFDKISGAAIYYLHYHYM